MIREKLRDENRRNFANEAARVLGIPAAYAPTVIVSRDVDDRSVRPLGAGAPRTTQHVYLCLFPTSIRQSVYFGIPFQMG